MRSVRRYLAHGPAKYTIIEVTLIQAEAVQTESPADEPSSVLTISPEKVSFIIVKAREFDAKDAVTEPDPGSNPSDDMEAAVLEEHEDDPWSRRSARSWTHCPRTSRSTS